MEIKLEDAFPYRKLGCCTQQLYLIKGMLTTKRGFVSLLVHI